MDAQTLVREVRQDVERSMLRARNGLRYLAGSTRTSVGLTPKHLVWHRDRARLYRYESDQRRGARPLLIVFSVMGRSYVLDLRPGNSFVEWMLAQGHDVFLLDFGEPGPADAGNALETYVDDYLPRAVRAVARAAGTEAVDMLGYCFGGVLTTLTVAAHPSLPVANVALMATPMDFSGMGGLFRTLVEGQLDIDDIIDDTGNVPAEAVLRMFRTLKPTAAIANYATLWERLWDDEFVDGFQAMAMWARDQVPFPGEAARQGLDLLLRRNVLMEGRVMLGGREVSLASIDHPLLVIIAEHDHLVPPSAARPILDLVSSPDTTELLVPAGHIGLATGRQARGTTIPQLTRWLTERDQ